MKMPSEAGASAPPPGARGQDRSGDSEPNSAAPAEAAATSARRRGRDPKSVVTPDAFMVSPELLGAPLAAPRRRLAAIVLDLFLVGLLDALSWRLLLGGAMLGLFLVLVRRPEAGRARRARRAARGCAATLLALAAVFATFLPTMVRQGGVLPPDVQLVLDSISHAMQGSPASEDGVLAAGDSLTTTGVGDSASAADAAPGLAVADSPAVAAPPFAPESLTAPTELPSAADSLPAAADPPSTAFAWIRDVADEAGLIFGWGTIYLTLFTALWDGRTPGKRVMGLRVVRLTGEPLGLFRCFERAGGYAAGVATGLLGFARVWWDPNRQAIHDKIAETVVVRERVRHSRQRSCNAATDASMRRSESRAGRSCGATADARSSRRRTASRSTKGTDAIARLRNVS